MIQEEPNKDRFWLYVGLCTFSLIGVLMMVKMNENEKFEPIKQQLVEEEKQMNIRVISNR